MSSLSAILQGELQLVLPVVYTSGTRYIRLVVLANVAAEMHSYTGALQPVAERGAKQTTMSTHTQRCTATRRVAAAVAMRHELCNVEFTLVAGLTGKLCYLDSQPLLYPLRFATKE